MSPYLLPLASPSHPPYPTPLGLVLRTSFLQESLFPPLPLLIIPLETAMIFFARSLVAQLGANKSLKSPRQRDLLEHIHRVYRFSRK